MRNALPPGPLCGCGNNQRLCECLREMDRRKCCDACEHHELPPDIRSAQ